MAVNTDRLLITSIDQITAYNNANELAFIMDELQDATLSNTQENTDITGKNGAVIGQLKRNKAVTISGNNGFIVGGVIAAQTGAEVEEGSFNVRTMEILTVTSNAATLTGTPVGADGAEIAALYKRNANGSLGEQIVQDATASEGKFSYADNTITFNAGELEDGSQVVVFYDMQVTNAAKISNDSNTYSSTLKLYIDITAQDNCDNVYRGQIVVPRASFTGNWDLALGGDTAAVQAFEATAMRDTCSGSGSLWDFYIWA